MAEKKYVPKAKVKEITNRFGTLIALGFHADTLISFIKENTNAQGYINLNITKKKTPDQFNNTHSIVLNDWQPGVNKVAQKESTRTRHEPPPEEDNVPF